MAADKADEVLSKLRRDLADKADLIFLDGVRAEFSDGWGLARKSVTEPLLTLRFEGEDNHALKRIINSFIEAAPELGEPLSKARIQK